MTFGQLKIRNQLRVSGVTFRSYWIMRLIPDVVIYYLTTIVLVAGFIIFEVQAFTNNGAVVSLIVVALGWGPSIVLATYVLSFIFKKKRTADSCGVILVQFIGIIPFTIVGTLNTLDRSEQADMFDILFCITIPFYTGMSGINGIYSIRQEVASQNIIKFDESIPFSAYFDFTQQNIPLSIICIYAHIIILYFLLRAIEVKYSGGAISDAFPFFCRICSLRSSAKRSRLNVDDETSDEHEEVISERELVNKYVDSPWQPPPVLILANIFKSFRNRARCKIRCCRTNIVAEQTPKTAVRNVSLLVEPGQVVGLLGPNGAGKTTTIGIVTAEKSPDRGHVYVAGNRIRSNTSQVYQNMGFCPQEDPIWEDLTLREHLLLYAVARGIPRKQRTSVIDGLIRSLEIEEHANKKGKALSGGNKRKLCFCIAMLNDSPLVLLDEPSTGQDPKTKRFMWDYIVRSFMGDGERAAVLTTHYMDEAEALCDRVAIMIKGRIRAIGTLQQLKDKFGKGYVLEVKLKDDRPESSSALQQLVKDLFDDIEDPEVFGKRYVYNVPVDKIVSLSNVFQLIEEAKSTIGIEQFSFSQSTLEQVFLEFAKEQDE